MNRVRAWRTTVTALFTVLALAAVAVVIALAISGGSGGGGGGSAAGKANALCARHEGVARWSNEGYGYVTATCKDGTAVDGDW